MKKRIYIITICLLAAVCIPTHALTLEEARKLFTQGEYEQALPVFKQELKYAKKDAALNYWYGSCLYHTGNKQEAVPYLTIGEKGRIKEASFLLADCAFEAHDHEKCIRHIDKYILYNTGKHKEELASMLKTIEKVKKMLENVEEVVFLDSITVPKADVLGFIRLHPSCGYLEEQSYHTEKQNRYYGALGVSHGMLPDSTERKDLDLFLFTKTLDKWESTRLDDNINKVGSNQTNPYLLSDGLTIYYASDEEGGIGGYDLYVSRYNDYTDTYYNPEPLPMPFNSYGNDLLYIVDEEVNRGYLVTDRNGYKDSLTVYSFVPNAQRKILKGKSAAEIALYARIASVSATQQGVNIDSILSVQEAKYLEAARYSQATKAEQSEAPRQDAFFVCDGLTYNSADDFKCQEAKKHYITYQKLSSELKANDLKLYDDRKRYIAIETIETPEAEKERNGLVNSILNGEYLSEKLSADMEQAANEARRLEIEFLKK